jgi:hypothetical protein
VKQLELSSVFNNNNNNNNNNNTAPDGTPRGAGGTPRSPRAWPKRSSSSRGGGGGGAVAGAGAGAGGAGGGGALSPRAPPPVDRSPFKNNGDDDVHSILEDWLKDVLHNAYVKAALENGENGGDSAAK